MLDTLERCHKFLSFIEKKATIVHDAPGDRTKEMAMLRVEVMTLAMDTWASKEEFDRDIECLAMLISVLKQSKDLDDVL